MAEPKYYIDNAEFRNIISKWRADKAQAELDDNPVPRIPEEAGRMIMMIAERYSYRPNFKNYMFRDEMVAAGVESAIRAFKNFDPERGSSPLSYFTQCIHFTFLGIIAKEKTLLRTRVQLIRDSMTDFMEVFEHDDSIDSSQRSFLMEFLDRNDHEIEFGFMDKEVKVVEKKEKPVVESPLDQFFGEDDES